MPPSNVPEIITGVVTAALTALSVGLAEPPVQPPSATPTTSTSAATSPAASAPRAVAASALAGPLQVYFGNLHSHTKYSDGSGTPAEALTFARGTGQLDFLAITEHNHNEAELGADERADGIMIATSPHLYDGPEPASLVSATGSHGIDGQFVALYGQEFSTISRGNHVNVFDVKGVIDVPKGDFKQLIDTWLPAHPDSTGTPQLIQFNHPFSKGPGDVGPEAPGESETATKARMEYGADDFGSAEAWVKAMDRHAQLIEVFNGPGTKEGTGLKPDRFQTQYLAYLNRGFHLGPTGNQDSHHPNWGTATEARTGVIASSLTKTSLLAALKARHTTATLDRNLRFIARAIVGGQEHLMGDLIAPPAPGTAFEVQYTLNDEDEPAASYSIEVLSDIVGGTDLAATFREVEQSGNTPASAAGRITGLTYDGGQQYFVIKVTQDAEHGSDDLLWTAPIWFETPTDTPPPSPAGPNPSGFLASKNSGIFHISAECRFAKTIKAENRISGAGAANGREMHQGCPVQ